MCKSLYSNNLNIDYFPTNFIVQNDLLYYVDYECNGEEKRGARERDALLEDTLEAFIAAIYLDLGLDVCRPFIINLIKNDIKDTKDNKSVLQEFLQRSIEYRLESETGPAHNKTFVCSAVVDNIVYGVGEGKTKKAAEQEAAKEALDILAKKQ